MRGGVAQGIGKGGTEGNNFGALAAASCRRLFTERSAIPSCVAQGVRTGDEQGEYGHEPGPAPRSECRGQQQEHRNERAHQVKPRTAASATPSAAPAASQSGKPAAPGVRITRKATITRHPSQTATSRSFFALVASCQAMGVVANGMLCFSTKR